MKKRGDLVFDGARLINLVMYSAILFTLFVIAYSITMEADDEFARQEHVWAKRVEIAESRNEKITHDNEALRERGVTDREYSLVPVPTRGALWSGYMLWLIPSASIVTILAVLMRYIGSFWWSSMFPDLYTLQRPHYVRSKQGSIKGYLTPDESSMIKPPWLRAWLRTWNAIERDGFIVGYFTGLTSERMDAQSGPIEVEKAKGTPCVFKVRVNRILRNTDTGLLEAVHEDEEAAPDRATMLEVEVEDGHWDRHLEDLQESGRERVVGALDMSSDVARYRVLSGTDTASFRAKSHERARRPSDGS